MGRTRALAWCIAGGLALALGGIGVVLPLLPTTPLVLLAAFCFARGSPRLARMLERHRVFGPIIADWRANGAIAPRYKLIAHLMMGGAFGLSLAVGVPWPLLLVQALCLMGASAYILSRPSRGRAG